MKKIIIKVLNKLGIIDRINLTFKTIVNNRSFYIPIIKKTGYEHIYAHEPWMVQLLDRILEDRRDIAYVDVGVNIGQTLLKLKSVDADIKYYGFEPNPACIYYVKELSKINRFKNVTFFPVGISDKTSLYELSFFSDDEADSRASMLSNFRPNQKTYRKEYIACFNINEIIEKFDLPPIGVIKIDVEGSEREVLEGLRNKIVADQPLIQLEVLPVYDEDNKERLDRQKAIEDLLGQINYTIFRIHSDENNNLNGLEEIETIGIHSIMKWCEYLLVPANMKEAIKKKF